MQGPSRVHKGQEGTSAKSARQPQPRSERTRQQPGASAATGIMSLQHQAGNAAVNRAIASPGGAGPTLMPTDGGKPLDPSTRAEMEAAFGQDFGQVRVHSDANAGEASREIGARAYTVGEKVVFAPGQYDPHTTEGRRLLAHELAHVAQGNRAPVHEGVSAPGDASEREAGRAADVVARGGISPALSTPTHSVARDVGWARRGPIPDPYGEYTILNEFAKKFEAAATLAFRSEAGMVLVKEAEAAGVTFGGYSEEGPAKDAWPYTIGKTVYVPKARTDPVLAMKGFLFELNNALRSEKFAALHKEAGKGSKGTLSAEQYAYKSVEQEVEGTLRMGEIWVATKKSSGKGKEWDKYDEDFWLSNYKDYKAGTKTKDDIINEVLKRKYPSGKDAGKTVKQYYMEQYKKLSGE